MCIKQRNTCAAAGKRASAGTLHGCNHVGGMGIGQQQRIRIREVEKSTMALRQPEWPGSHGAARMGAGADDDAGGSSAGRVEGSGEGDVAGKKRGEMGIAAEWVTGARVQEGPWPAVCNSA